MGIKKKNLLWGVLLAVFGTVLTILAWSFTPMALRVPDEPPTLAIPQAHPPAGVSLSALRAGKMFSLAMFAYRGGSPFDERVFGMGGILVRHPQGLLLFDSGFGAQVDEHFKTIPPLMQAVSKYEKETPVAMQLRAAGIEPSALKGIVLTHAHWDHVSGLPDLAGAPVWVSRAELNFIHSGDPAVALAHSFHGIDYRAYDFPNGAYLGFEHSYDVFGDGSVVLVPAPGHTPGSIIAFINTSDGRRYALIGDLAWQAEGVEIPAEKPWLSRDMVDADEARVRALLVQLHQLKRVMPDLQIVPAHDRRVWDGLPHFAS